MKTTLHLISLLTVGGYAAAQFARFAGYDVPAAINASNAVVVLTFAVVALLVAADYGQPRRLRAISARAAALDTRVVQGRPARRQAYSIRRGAEAARLAAPSVVVRFPAAPRVRCERVA